MLTKTLRQICPTSKIEKNISLKPLSFMRTGGRAKWLVRVGSVSELVSLVNFLKMKRVKFFVLGNGSNVLMCDKKYKGVLIKLDLLSRVKVHKNFIFAEAGATLAGVIAVAVRASLAGLEEGTGIPASVGGAVKMNASAFNFEIAKVLRGVHVLREGKVIYLRAKDCGFSYRHSGFLPGDIILSADFKLTKAPRREIKERQKQTALKRHIPLPSLGSVFKREENIIVSKLLDEMKMKGLRRGGAMVSHEHAGVIVNLGDAKSDDVKDLIKEIKARVYQQKNIILHEEIVYLE